MHKAIKTEHNFVESVLSCHLVCLLAILVPWKIAHLQKLLLSEMIIQSYVLLRMDKLLLLFGGQRSPLLCHFQWKD